MAMTTNEYRPPLRAYDFTLPPEMVEDIAVRFFEDTGEYPVNVSQVVRHCLIAYLGKEESDYFMPSVKKFRRRYWAELDVDKILARKNPD